MIQKKYILTEKPKNYLGYTLYQIQAIKDFGDVKKGDLGGWIRSEDNLSQKHSCWVYDDAVVYEDARVFGDAKVRGNADIHGTAKVGDHAEVYDCAMVTMDAMVIDYAKVYGNALIYDRAWIFEHAKVFGKAQVFSGAQVSGKAKVFGEVSILGNAYIVGDAIIKCNLDYMVFQNNWTYGNYFTWTKSNNKWKVGSFYGTGEKLIEKAYKVSKEDGWYFEQFVKFNELLANHKP